MYTKEIKNIADLDVKKIQEVLAARGIKLFEDGKKI